MIIPMTTAEEPYIKADWIKSGSLYSAVSLLDPELEVLMQSDLIIVDDERLCKHEGRPLQRLEAQGRLDEKRIVEIGSWLRDPSLAQRKVEQRVFFNPMGTIITDLAVASLVIEIAFERGVGTHLPV